MYLKEIGLRAQKILIILGSMVNIIGMTCTNFQWAWEYNIHMDSRRYEENDYNLTLDELPISY